MDALTGHVVVGYDGSEPSAQAVDWAADEARRRGLPLTVLHAVDYRGMLPNTMGPPGWPTVLGGDPTAIAGAGATRARDRGCIDVSARTVTTGAAGALVDASRTASLLVVATQGCARRPGVLLGPTTFTVTGHAHCPVVVVHGDTTRRVGPERPVIVGFDGSPGAVVALGHAADVAAESGAPLTVITAYQPISPWSLAGVQHRSRPPASVPPDVDAVARNTARETAIDALRIARRRHPGLPATQRAERGPAAEILARSAREAGLLVIGSRGHGGFTGLLLGSVGHRLIHLSPCPLAVVHDGTPRTEKHPVSAFVARPA